MARTKGNSKARRVVATLEEHKGNSWAGTKGDLMAGKREDVMELTTEQGAAARLEMTSELLTAA